MSTIGIHLKCRSVIIYRILYVYVYDYSQNCFMKFRTERSLKESVSLSPIIKDTKYSGEDILPLFKVHFDSVEMKNDSTELKLNIQ